MLTFPALAPFFLTFYLNPKARRARIIIKKKMVLRAVLPTGCTFIIIQSLLDKSFKKLMNLWDSQLAHQGNNCAVAAIPFAGQPTCLSGNSVGRKFVNFSHRANLPKASSQLVGNGPRTGACLEYLSPTAMPVGLAGLNVWKIALVRC